MIKRISPPQGSGRNLTSSCLAITNVAVIITAVVLYLVGLSTWDKKEFEGFGTYFWTIMISLPIFLLLYCGLFIYVYLRHNYYVIGGCINDVCTLLLLCLLVIFCGIVVLAIILSGLLSYYMTVSARWKCLIAVVLLLVTSLGTSLYFCWLGCTHNGINKKRNSLAKWSCEKCTVINKPDNDQCEICGTKKTAVVNQSLRERVTEFRDRLRDTMHHKDRGQSSRQNVSHERLQEEQSHQENAPHIYLNDQINQQDLVHRILIEADHRDDIYHHVKLSDNKPQLAISAEAGTRNGKGAGEQKKPYVQKLGMDQPPRPRYDENIGIAPTIDMCRRNMLPSESSANNGILIFDESKITNGPITAAKTSVGFEYIHMRRLFSIEYICEGHYGHAFKARLNSPLGEYVCIKAPKADVQRSDGAELKVMMMLSAHPNVCLLRGQCCEFKYPPVKQEAPGLVTPYQENGSVDDYLRKSGSPPGHLKLNDYINIVLGETRGIAHLHKHNVVHRDIAQRNFLVGDDGRILTTDFGLSRFLTPYSPPNIYCYTEHLGEMLHFRDAEGAKIPWRWCAPETLVNDVSSKKSDIWMLGIAITELFEEGDPFPNTRNPRMHIENMFKINSDSFDFNCPDSCHILQNIVRQCCQVEPENRPTAQEIINILLKSV